MEIQLEMLYLIQLELLARADKYGHISMESIHMICLLLLLYKK